MNWNRNFLDFLKGHFLRLSMFSYFLVFYKMGSSHSTPPQTPQPGTVTQRHHRAQLVATSGPSPRGSLRPELSRTGVIKNSVNFRKSGLSLVSKPDGRAAITFIFDSSVETRFRIYFSCSEFLNEKKYPILASELPILESHSFNPGLDQKYSFDIPESLAAYDPESKVFPVIVETVPADEATGAAAQLTYLNINNGKATVIKQKLRYGDRAYELHEIFGIERSNDKSPTSVVSERLDLDDVNGTDCVICLTNTRDTTIIPCLHLCLCAHCAQVLSLNTRKCPVCRSPVTGMLQIDRDLPPPSPAKNSFDNPTSS